MGVCLLVWSDVITVVTLGPSTPLKVALESTQQASVHFRHFTIFKRMEQKLLNLNLVSSLEINLKNWFL
jgi:hypothetical protein